MSTRPSKRHIINIIGTVNYISLGLDKKDVLLTERQYVNTTATSSTTCIQSNKKKVF